jgi:hypothetical protein
MAKKTPKQVIKETEVYNANNILPAREALIRAINACKTLNGIQRRDYINDLPSEDADDVYYRGTSAINILSNSFDWAKTKKGFWYWQELANHLRKPQ